MHVDEKEVYAVRPNTAILHKARTFIVVGYFSFSQSTVHSRNYAITCTYCTHGVNSSEA